MRSLRRVKIDGHDPSEPEKITRDEHLKWCKERALEYVRAGDVQNAWASMVSDLNKHDETRNHIGIEMGMRLMVAGHLSSITQMEAFIRGFN